MSLINAKVKIKIEAKEDDSAERLATIKYFDQSKNKIHLLLDEIEFINLDILESNFYTDNDFLLCRDDDNTRYILRDFTDGSPYDFNVGDIIEVTYNNTDDVHDIIVDEFDNDQLYFHFVDDIHKKIQQINLTNGLNMENSHKFLNIRVIDEDDDTLADDFTIFNSEIVLDQTDLTSLSKNEKINILADKFDDEFKENPVFKFDSNLSLKIASHILDAESFEDFVKRKLNDKMIYNFYHEFRKISPGEFYKHVHIKEDENLPYNQKMENFLNLIRIFPSSTETKKEIIETETIGLTNKGEYINLLNDYRNDNLNINDQIKLKKMTLRNQPDIDIKIPGNMSEYKDIENIIEARIDDSFQPKKIKISELGKKEYPKHSKVEKLKNFTVSEEFNNENSDTNDESDDSFNFNGKMWPYQKKPELNEDKRQIFEKYTNILKQQIGIEKENTEKTSNIHESWRKIIQKPREISESKTENITSNEWSSVNQISDPIKRDKRLLEIITSGKFLRFATSGENPFFLYDINSNSQFIPFYQKFLIEERLFLKKRYDVIGSFGKLADDDSTIISILDDSVLHRKENIDEFTGRSDVHTQDVLSNDEKMVLKLIKTFITDFDRNSYSQAETLMKFFMNTAFYKSYKRSKKFSNINETVSTIMKLDKVSKKKREILKVSLEVASKSLTYESYIEYQQLSKYYDNIKKFLLFEITSEKQKKRFKFRDIRDPILITTLKENIVNFNEQIEILFKMNILILCASHIFFKNMNANRQTRILNSINNTIQEKYSFDLMIDLDLINHVYNKDLKKIVNNSKKTISYGYEDYDLHWKFPLIEDVRTKFKYSNTFFANEKKNNNTAKNLILTLDDNLDETVIEESNKQSPSGTDPEIETLQQPITKENQNKLLFADLNKLATIEEQEQAYKCLVKRLHYIFRQNKISTIVIPRVWKITKNDMKNEWQDRINENFLIRTKTFNDFPLLKPHSNALLKIYSKYRGISFSNFRFAWFNLMTEMFRYITELQENEIVDNFIELIENYKEIDCGFIVNTISEIKSTTQSLNEKERKNVQNAVNMNDASKEISKRKIDTSVDENTILTPFNDGPLDDRDITDDITNEVDVFDGSDNEYDPS